jgi:hypothetical protein
MLPPEGTRECGRFRVAQDLANLCRPKTGLAQVLQCDVGAHPVAQLLKGRAGFGQPALKDLPEMALKKIGDNQSSLGGKVAGWQITKGLGVYGTDYMKRAVVAAFGWPANVQQDAVYPYTTVDSNGETLTGANNYTITFTRGQTPPVDGFWSFTMYMIDKGWWFVPNKLNKFTVSMRDKPVFDEDGSLTLYFQRESPGKDKEANWLPAPEGEFIPMLRMYWPKEKRLSILDGTWMPPQVVKVN